MVLELGHLTRISLLLEVAVTVVHVVLLMAILEISFVKMMLRHHGSMLNGRGGLSDGHHGSRRSRRRPRGQQTLDGRSTLTGGHDVLHVRFQPVVTQFAVLLRFHSPILEPDFDLPLGQAQSLRYFYATSSGEVPIEVKFLLQLEGLETSIGLSCSLVSSAICVACNIK